MNIKRKKDVLAQQALVAKRRKARHYAVQGLYQWQMAGTSIQTVLLEFKDDYDFSKVDSDYFDEILLQSSKLAGQLDATLTPLLDRDIHDLGPVELALLRLSMYEMCHRIDVPYKVVINEAVALAKKFGASESHKFVNGVLDRAARQLRATEWSLKDS